RRWPHSGEQTYHPEACRRFDWRERDYPSSRSTYSAGFAAVITSRKNRDPAWSSLPPKRDCFQITVQVNALLKRSNAHARFPLNIMTELGMKPVMRKTVQKICSSDFSRWSYAFWDSD